MNRKSIAFKKQSVEEQINTTQKSIVINLMKLNTNLIKRPVVEIAGTVLHGFDEQVFKNTFGKP